MSAIAFTKLYELLSARVGKETAENLTTFIEDKIKNEVESKSQILATKEDLAREVTRLDLRISESKIDLINRITESKIDLIKWMFAFWVTLALMVIGLYLKK